MRIIVEMTPEEAKEMLTPGERQVTMYTDMTLAFTKAWMKTLGEIQSNARFLTQPKKG